MNKAPTTLIIMDGFGLRKETDGNAVAAAATPVLDRLFAENAWTELQASGRWVGLPDGQMGNSEVGHTNIGGGRVVFQDLPRISNAVADGSFFANAAYLHAMETCRAQGTALHLMGLLSDGGVHSHIEHLYALLRMAKRQGLEKVYIHAFLDGRDVSPSSGLGFVEETVRHCAEIGVGRIATVMGRYYAMDRDKRWDRVEQAYDAMVYGEGSASDPDPVHAVRESYAGGVTDEFVEPVVCDAEGSISDNDSVIFFNFRPDRARELTRALVDPEFSGFTRQLFPLTFVCTTEYDASMPNVEVAFPRQSVVNGLGEYLDGHPAASLHAHIHLPGALGPPGESVGSSTGPGQALGPGEQASAGDGYMPRQSVVHRHGEVRPRDLLLQPSRPDRRVPRPEWAGSSPASPGSSLTWHHVPHAQCGGGMVNGLGEYLSRWGR